SGLEDAGRIERVLDAAHQEIAVRPVRPGRKARAEVFGAPLDATRTTDSACRDEERLGVADDGLVIARELSAGHSARRVGNERAEALEPAGRIRERGRSGKRQGDPHQGTIGRARWKLARDGELVAKLVAAALACRDLAA